MEEGTRHASWQCQRKDPGSIMCTDGSTSWLIISLQVFNALKVNVSGYELKINFKLTKSEPGPASSGTRKTLANNDRLFR